MSRIFGFLVGVVWLGFVAVAVKNSAAGWSADATDLGFWWAVIAVFLTLASGAAFVGTWLHTRPRHYSVAEPVDRGAQAMRDH